MTIEVFGLKSAHRFGVQWRIGILILSAVGFLTGFQTDALRANWKYAGESPPGIEGEKTFTFYDSENIEYLADGNVKVWVKSVDASEIEEIASRDKSILKKAGDKAVQSYSPPYILSQPEQAVSANRYIEMIEWEEAANHADAKPRSKRLYEISCRERKSLAISTILYKSDGATTYSSDFGRWSPIIPDSTGEALENMLCR